MDLEIAPSVIFDRGFFVSGRHIDAKGGMMVDRMKGRRIKREGWQGGGGRRTADGGDKGV